MNEPKTRIEWYMAKAANSSVELPTEEVYKTGLSINNAEFVYDSTDVSYLSITPISEEDADGIIELYLDNILQVIVKSPSGESYLAVSDPEDNYLDNTFYWVINKKDDCAVFVFVFNPITVPTGVWSTDFQVKTTEYASSVWPPKTNKEKYWARIAGLDSSISILDEVVNSKGASEEETIAPIDDLPLPQTSEEESLYILASSRITPAPGPGDNPIL